MSLLERLLARVGARPEQLIFSDEGKQFPGHQWITSTIELAGQLKAHGVAPGVRVIVTLGRGTDAAMAVYATLWLGATYVPVDSTSPAARCRQILDDVGAQLVISIGECPDWVEPTAYFDISTSRPSVDAPHSPHRIDPEDIAAILFTSGSTGTPKGIAVSHRAIESFADWTQETFRLDQDDRIASLAPFHFDLSLFDLFCGPCMGASTSFVPKRLKLAPSKLADWLQREQISCWYTVPSILGFLALKGGLRERTLPALRLVLFAGEVFHSVRLQSLVEQLPDVRFYNLFGPTETNVCLYWPVDRTRLQDGKPIPIGKAACQAELCISATDNELLMRGPCLMSGYWQHNDRPVLPLDSDGWFHTGDKVSLGGDSVYHFHGRLDRMIKSAGYRVEPAEIERLLNSIVGIESAAVMSMPDPVSGSRIVAAVCGNDLSQQLLRKTVADELPGYMRPAFYVFPDSMPVLANGKTDYQALGRMIDKELS